MACWSEWGRSPLLSLLFFSTATAIVGLGHLYLWFRLARSTELPRPIQRIAALFVAGAGATLPVFLIALRSLPRSFAKPLSFVLFTWAGVVVFLVFTLLAGELLRLLERISARDNLRAERRTFLARGIAVAAAASSTALAGVGLARALRPPVVTQVRVALTRLPREFGGFKIAQLTDLHIGAMLGREWLTDVVASTNALHPDLIAITGDLVDGSVETLREHVAPLADLKATHGVFFVTGNHEYYSGANEWIAELERLGIRVLRNERVLIERSGQAFDLAGVDDWSAAQRLAGHGPDLDKALAGRDTSRELILLAHQPKQITLAQTMGVGLQLSGHTHGGQFFPIEWFVRLQQPFVAGLGKQGDTFIYVNPGTGYWGPPMRHRFPSEIALITLESPDRERAA